MWKEETHTFGRLCCKKINVQQLERILVTEIMFAVKNRGNNNKYTKTSIKKSVKSFKISDVCYNYEYSIPVVSVLCSRSLPGSTEQSF